MASQPHSDSQPRQSSSETGHNARQLIRGDVMGGRAECELPEFLHGLLAAKAGVVSRASLKLNCPFASEYVDSQQLKQESATSKCDHREGGSHRKGTGNTRS